MALVEVRGIVKRFGLNTVLDQIDLTVEDHQVVCLIGASGSGKSTLLRCINGLEPTQGGTITVDGREVIQDDIKLNRLRRDVGIVFQAFNLFPHMTVLDNVTLGPRKALHLSKADAEARAQPLLDRIGLADKAEEYPDRLSGGQQQRVAIIRALAMQPKLLLLDEITSALDPELVNEVLHMMQELAEQGMTMVVATHEMGFARDVASKVCYLHKGQIIEEGPPEKIFKNPDHVRTSEFLRRTLEAGRM
jgi:polar amino acid transport system ATP-binding protein